MVLFQLTAFGLIIGAIGAFAIKRQQKEDEFFYRIERTPPIQLEDVIEGVPIKLTGKVVPIEVLKSRFEGRSCVYFISERQELKKQGKSSNWVTALHDFQDSPFYLDDGTGKIRIDLHTANKEFLETEKILNWEGYEGGLGQFGPFNIGGLKVRKYEWIIPSDGKMFIYGMPRKFNGAMELRQWKESEMAASVNDEKTFLKNKRTDDKKQVFVGYAIAVVGAILIVASFFWPG
ncbi:MAG: GIDE domain-containing protein [Candidatus Micrarchaeota archaeon]